MSTSKKETKKTAPKVVRKAVAKATKATKKPAAKAVKKACGCKKACTDNQAFWVNNGPIVHSLKDLVQALKTMSDEQYAYHTKRDGNDFARWVQDCLADKECAKKLIQARTRVGAARVLSGCTCC